VHTHCPALATEAPSLPLPEPYHTEVLSHLAGMTQNRKVARKALTATSRYAVSDHWPPCFRLSLPRSGLCLNLEQHSMIWAAKHASAIQAAGYEEA